MPTEPIALSVPISGRERNDTTFKLTGQHTRVRAKNAREDLAMKNVLFEGSINVPIVAQRHSAERKSEKLCVLVAKRTASLLQDAALTSLFHSYRVELFQNPFDLFVSKSTPISYALLCASAGCSLLAAEAHIIRKQWPMARILVLGLAPLDLDDNLYDDSVPPNCSAAVLAIAFETRSVDLWDQGMGWNNRKASRSRVPEESDPTKADPSDLLQSPIAAPRDLPQTKRGIWRTEPVQIHSPWHEPEAAKI
jgi:hypothetical protein